MLNYLSDGQPAKSATLRHATGATAELLTNMLRKKWLLRETEAAPRDARRTGALCGAGGRCAAAQTQ